MYKQKSIKLNAVPAGDKAVTYDKINYNLIHHNDKIGVHLKNKPLYTSHLMCAASYN
jgi:hypothetical protein